MAKGSGWDWFGLQLSDGRELLLNQMSSGQPMANVIEEDGSIRFTRSITFKKIKRWKRVCKVTGRKGWLMERADHSLEKVYGTCWVCKLKNGNVAASSKVFVLQNQGKFVRKSVISSKI
ncbi:lipocalin family protein [Bacillus sp. ISL-45]|uniref:lipocalin family protein n=1 Tax=Bacillus sp. ISL-45 TaxID=2819128 RepID=UPI001BE8F1CF|nr:lipocalin family protein [Bacillus sp. ISL-45]MBT2662065.1 hypothetical protein [Bacillus sp. ISL-45]